MDEQFNRLLPLFVFTARIESPSQRRSPPRQSAESALCECDGGVEQVRWRLIRVSLRQSCLSVTDRTLVSSVSVGEEFPQSLGAALPKCVRDWSDCRPPPDDRRPPDELRMESPVGRRFLRLCARRNCCRTSEISASSVRLSVPERHPLRCDGFERPAACFSSISLV